MTIAYMAHPISGNIEANLADLRRIVRKINLEYPEVIPFVPYYVDIVSLDDTVPEERERGIKNDMEILDRCIPDELWLTGPKVSFGMQMEAERARQKGIKVVDLTGQL